MAYRYKTIKFNGKTKLLHRHVMEQKLGRPLSAKEIVHHINGDKHDNRPENLEVLTAQEHSKHHNQKHPISKTCPICGSVFTPKPTKRARQKTCSKSCRFKLMAMTKKGIKPAPVAEILKAVEAA